MIFKMSAVPSTMLDFRNWNVNLNFLVRLAVNVQDNNYNQSQWVDVLVLILDQE